jgi:hypothetical protein
LEESAPIIDSIIVIDISTSYWSSLMLPINKELSKKLKP